MKAQITIIGLGQIGASIGLRLGEYPEKILRVGYDLDIATAEGARKLNAVDKNEVSLPLAAAEADVVVLALPVDQILETMEDLAPDLKEGAVVLDCSPLRASLSQKVGELLPVGRYYIGFVPLLGPKGLEVEENGIENADADLFKKGQFAITAPAGTPEQGLKLAADMARLLGAFPLFADEVEVDGLMAAVHTLPQLMAAALTGSVVETPGWREKAKFAGRVFRQTAAPIINQDPATALAAMAQLNPENTLRVIDNLQSKLDQLREQIAGQEWQALQDELQRAEEAYRKWQQERASGNMTGEELPGVEIGKYRANWFGNLFGGGKDLENKD